MADDKLELDIIINAANSAQTVGELKQSLKDIHKAIAQVGPDSKEFEKLTIAAGKVKGEMMDLKSQIKALDPNNRFATFGKVLGGVANGFGAATAAAALFGSESEDLQKALLKVQAAMAFANALQGLDQLKDSFKELNAIVRSNPIGALIFALTALAAVGAKIYDQYFSVGAQLKKNYEIATQLVELEQKKLSAISDQENSLRLAGKSEKEILQMKVEQTNEVLKALRLQMIAQLELNKNQEETAIRGKNILEGILKFISVPIKFITQQVDWLMNALGEESNLTKNLDANIASFFFNPEDTRKKGAETLKALEEEVNKILNQKAGFILASQKLDEDEKVKKEEVKATEEQEAIDADAQMKKDWADALLEMEQQLNSESDLLKGELDKRLAYERAYLLARKSLNDAYWGAVNGAFELAKAFAGKNKSLQDAIFLVEKGAAAAKTFISMRQEIAGIYAKYALVPGGAAVAQLEVTAARIRGWASIASIVGTSIAKFMTGGGGQGSDGGGGGGMGAAANGVSGFNPQPQSSTLLNPDGTVVNPNKEQQPVKAYVVETEMTSSQNKIASIENRARY